MSTKLAMVTGGGRGLGRDMALRLAEKGMDVILTYNSREKDALDVATRIREKGRKAAVLRLDAGNVSSFDAFFMQLKDILSDTFETDKFDFLVNNGGIGGHAPFNEMTEAM